MVKHSQKWLNMVKTGKNGFSSSSEVHKFNLTKTDKLFPQRSSPEFTAKGKLRVKCLLDVMRVVIKMSYR